MSTIKTIYRDDRLARVDITTFEIGGVPYFSFHEETWYECEHPATGEPDCYWGPGTAGFGGGIYESESAAEAACYAAVPWLRNR